MTQYDPRQRDLNRVQRVLQRLFPERQLVLRSGAEVRSLRLGTLGQVAGALALAGALGWSGYTSWAYIGHHSIVSAKEAEAAEARLAYHTLLAQVGAYRDKVSQVAESLELNHRYTMTLLSRNDHLGQRLAEIETELASSEAEKVDAVRAREALVGHLRKLRADLQSAAAQGGEPGGELSGEAPQGEAPAGDAKATAAATPAEKAAGAQAAFNQQPAAARQEVAARERDQLRAELAMLGEGLARLGQDGTEVPDVADLEIELRQVVLQRDRAQAENTALQQEVATLKAQVVQMETTQVALFQRFATLAQERISDLEATVGKTGLRLKDVLERAGSGTAGQGGPFVPLESTLLPEGALRRTLAALNGHIARWDTLQGVVDALPTGKPVRDFRITSTFGARRDPFNGTMAMHQGLDMAAPIGTPVYATAPGKVVYAGWRGRYGRLIEIDHGNGMKTRFGHLHKINVRKGDVVDRGSRIGQVGNSGRSSGPHVHYEVLVNGQPRNPDKFIRAGANVHKG